MISLPGSLCSTEERFARRRVRPVNLLVAHHAAPSCHLVAVGRVLQHEVVVDGRWVPRRHVTPLAEERHLGHEHPFVVRAVRIVAGDTRVRDGRVFPEVGATLFGMTARARFVDGGARLQQLRIGRAMRIVAGRTLHLVLADGHMAEAMLLLVDDILVARCAEQRLVHRLQLRRTLRRMNTVAGETAQVALIVLAARPERVGASVVARRAIGTRLLRFERRHPHDLRSVAARLCVRRPGAVAALAAASSRRCSRVRRWWPHTGRARSRMRLP